MKFNEYIDKNECGIIRDVCCLNETIVPEKIYTHIKNIGMKMGIKVSKTTSLFEYLASAERTIVDLFDSLCLYVLAGGQKEKTKQKDEIRKLIRRIKKEEIVNFLNVLDGLSFGLTSVFRKLLMTIFGLKISSYSDWKNDVDYILDSIKKIRYVMHKREFTDEEMDALDKLEDLIIRTKEEIEEYGD